MTNNSKSYPLISIIVPVFNGERYLRECLDSIVGQTFPNMEVLIMDDASTDSTPDIVSSYGGDISYYRQPENRGAFENVNAGIELVQGDYIAVYHADDVYHPAIVEREVEFLEYNPDAGAVFCKDIFIDPCGNEYDRLKLPFELRDGGSFDYPTILNALLTYKNRFLRAPSSMVRASVYREVGTFRGKEFSFASDLEMWVRIARRYRIGILNEYLFRYRHGHRNLTHEYHYLRTEPEIHFQIMDGCLEQAGYSFVTPESLAAHEAHRAEDRIMRVINHYIMNQSGKSLAILSQVRPGHILGSSRVQRVRLFVLYIALHVLVRVPRITAIANLFHRRWQIKKYHLKA